MIECKWLEMKVVGKQPLTFLMPSVIRMAVLRNMIKAVACA